MFSLTTLSLLAAVATVTAHMDVQSPAPLRSKFNTFYTNGNVDYNNLSPLAADGSNFPCKGYQADVPSVSGAVTTLKAGGSLNVQMEGSATHGGGSCQFSISYDNGKTFGVLSSVVGGCPLAANYTVDIPKDIPSGKNALLSWTWFNKVGNREMYMNCAMITIGGSSNRNAPVDAKEASKKTLDEKTTEKGPNNKANGQTSNSKANTQTTNAKNSFDSLPDLFVANANQAGNCVTIEGQAVHFPNPGPKLIGKADGPGYKCADHAPFLESTSDSKSKPSTTSKSEKKPAATTSKSEKKPATTSTSTTTTKAVSKIAQPFGTPSPTADSRELSTDASSTNQFVNNLGQWSCHSGDLICSPDGLSFALCTNGKPVFMGSVAAGTICRLGAITAR